MGRALPLPGLSAVSMQLPLMLLPRSAYADHQVTCSEKTCTIFLVHFLLNLHKKVVVSSATFQELQACFILTLGARGIYDCGLKWLGCSSSTSILSQ